LLQDRSDEEKENRRRSTRGVHRGARIPRARSVSRGSARKPPFLRRDGGFRLRQILYWYYFIACRIEISRNYEDFFQKLMRSSIRVYPRILVYETYTGDGVPLPR